MEKEKREFLAKYVEDLHSLVTHGLRPVSRQVDESSSRGHPEATRVIVDIQRTLQEHARLLSEHMEALGTSPSTAIQDAAAALTGIVAGIYNQVRTEAVSKSVRDDYTFLSHCSISWLMLMTTARALGDHDTEELAERGYRDSARLVMQIDQLMPKLVVQELQQDGFAAQDVSTWAHRIISDAWSRSQMVGANS